MIRLRNSQIRTLDLIAAGHNYQEIADLQGVTKGTVGMQVKRIRAKIGIKTQGHNALLLWMSENGWELPNFTVTKHVERVN